MVLNQQPFSLWIYTFKLMVQKSEVGAPLVDTSQAGGKISEASIVDFQSKTTEGFNDGIPTRFSSWWFEIFFISTTTWGDDPI